MCTSLCEYTLHHFSLIHPSKSSSYALITQPSCPAVWDKAIAIAALKNAKRRHFPSLFLPLRSDFNLEALGPRNRRSGGGVRWKAFIAFSGGRGGEKEREDKKERERRRGKGRDWEGWVEEVEEERKRERDGGWDKSITRESKDYEGETESKEERVEARERKRECQDERESTKMLIDGVRKRGT